ncbi:Zn-dependent hydrolase [Paracoccus sp. 1_MG-2023]|uniref:Zn-dependent hydrolase n=1 Tax=unclassified Paracoccus (in: a-proteobacteria) TaxID=2688777 RepID=UPI001C09F2E6|nr:MULTISPECIES: Zn-dependent hydrolase [unclassified Paracoccus (in: a-proteobacteria)]MBU2958779.1 Zn-dependent hydrolase [Paracoccus sp. C2R09]MDO6667772.1 Zn-dependent hydrolase [Paracoccus sp. 1_MG-2023]
MTAPNMTVDGDRLWSSLEQMAKVGPGIAGGCNRQTLTDADAEGRTLFAGWCRDAGMSMTLDRMGNMFMRHEGTQPDLDPIYIGSHLDTQPTGGKYDGVLGVLAGLEVVRAIRDMGLRTRRPIVVVNWTNEEGTRFAPSMLASGVFTGMHSEEYANSRVDAEGKTFGDELDRIGWRGDEAPGDRRIHAMFEYHIEQGPILEAENKQIGVVTHGQGLWWLEVTLTGKDAHTGSTPMSMRVNAGLGMARITEAVHRIAMAHQPDAVGAVGQANLYPNSRNVIPGKAVFTIDFRTPDAAKLASMRSQLEVEAAEIAKELGLGLQIEVTGHYEPVTFDPTLVGKVRDAADRLGLSHMDIVSGAGHDACWISKVAPTAMIFCPCVDGLSHNEAEEISPEWAKAGCDVLLHAVLDAAEIVT